MTIWRNKWPIKGATQKHEEFIDRIRKSFYFGGGTLDDDMEVSRPLAEYASELFSEPHKGHSLNRLNRVAAGSVHATPCSLIMALIYLDRVNVYDPGYVRRITPHELFIVSMMISTKFYADYDEDIYLCDWAEDGCMTEERLKQLEREFLNTINWDVYISTEQFFNKLTKIEHTLAQREGLRRGWLTYTELAQLLPSFTVVRFLFNNITVMAASYTAGVMTIAGAFFLASQLPVLSLQSSNVSRSSDFDANENNATNKAPKDAALIAASKQQQQRSRLSAKYSVTTSSEVSNGSYVLNVEAELLKLYRQYQEEALLEEMRDNQNEFATVPHKDVFKSVQLMVQLRRAHDSHQNWLALKEEYSDEDWQKLRNALQALTTTVQRIIVIMAFIYGQRLQFRKLHDHFIPAKIRCWCGRKTDHASTAFLLLQIFIVYKACGHEIFDTTLYLKELLM